MLQFVIFSEILLCTRARTQTLAHIATHTHFVFRFCRFLFHFHFFFFWPVITALEIQGKSQADWKPGNRAASTREHKFPTIALQLKRKKEKGVCFDDFPLNYDHKTPCPWDLSQRFASTISWILRRWRSVPNWPLQTSSSVPSFLTLELDDLWGSPWAIMQCPLVFSPSCFQASFRKRRLRLFESNLFTERIDAEGGRQPPCLVILGIFLFVDDSSPFFICIFHQCHFPHLIL